MLSRSMLHFNLFPPLYIVTHTKSNYPLRLTMQQLEEFFNDTLLTLPAC